EGRMGGLPETLVREAERCQTKRQPRCDAFAFVEYCAHIRKQDGERPAGVRPSPRGQGRHGERGLPITPAYTSSSPTRWAFSSMHLRRGSTAPRISIGKSWSASTTSSIVTFFRMRVAGFIVVTASCSGFISPRPL